MGITKNGRIVFQTFKFESAQLVLHYEDDHVAKLTNLIAEEPRRGHATYLMQTLAQWADKNAVAIWLEVQRFGDPHVGLDNAQLVRFYQSFGFDISEERRRPVIMTREPLERKTDEDERYLP